MNKTLSIAIILLLLSMAASAQVDARRSRISRDLNTGTITRVDRIQLHRDQLRLRLVERNARRDGIITRGERKRIQHARKKSRIKAAGLRRNANYR